jgi:hypothetical protein
MIIHDLEFFNSCDREYQKSNIAVRGGASASSESSTGDGEASAMAWMETEGDNITYSVTVDGDKVTKKSGKKKCTSSKFGNYSASYKAEYGNFSSSFTTD